MENKIDQPDQEILNTNGNNIESIPSSLKILNNKKLKKHFDSSMI